jgi:16S rRNA (guanine527-N7)-methyltransferase
MDVIFPMLDRQRAIWRSTEEVQICLMPMESGILNSERVAELLHPYLSVQCDVPPSLYDQLVKYLELLLKWNSRINLTAIREPEEIVRRHFGESLFAAQHLGECTTLLDFGSGAGFPGLPIQLFRPTLQITLAESQNKKASFLREAVRSLSLPTEVWAARVETLPAQRRFDVVVMRAVDGMEDAIHIAACRAQSKLMLLSTATHNLKVPDEFELDAIVAMAQSSNQTLIILRRV